MPDAASAPFSLTLDTMIPELLRRHPQARAVLDRHGLRGCGGPEGPHEALGFFARAHGIDEGRLMDELRRVVAIGAHHAADRAVAGEPSSLADAIYRPYFLAAIGVMLTLGGAWGVWLLWRIGVSQSFSGVSIYEINAHGHAQIFGWVGLFVMGFALQALPRMWHVALPAPGLAIVSFVAMVVGITVRTVAMAMAGVAWAAPAAMLGGAVELFAIVSFVGILLTAFARSEVRMEPYMAFLLAGLGWFVLQAGFGLWHTWTTMTAVNRNELLWYVSTYQGPLRNLQIHGLALFMILGVSIRMLPAIFGVPRIADRRAWVALGLLVTAVTAEVVLFIIFRWTNNPAFAGGVFGAWVLLAVGAAMVALPWRMWKPLPTRDRSAKFVRAAYGWLAVSLAMLLLLPVYQIVSGVPFSHAYYGAVRHAIAVGFISLMIMGMAAKIVPTLTGRDPRALTALWGPFLLVNLGCLMRVSTQTLTDWYPGFFFGVIGVSGALEGVGIVWWAGHLTWMMLTGPAEGPDTPSPLPRPERVLSSHNVADVLAWFPQTMAVFERFGFTMLRNAAARRVFARRVTVAQAAGMRGVSLDDLLKGLNEVLSSASMGALRYDTPLTEVVEQWPDAAEVLTRHGVTPGDDREVTLGQAADRDGVSKEMLVAELAQVAVASDADGDKCSGRCETCHRSEQDAAAGSCGKDSTGSLLETHSHRTLKEARS